MESIKQVRIRSGETGNLIGQDLVAQAQTLFEAHISDAVQIQHVHEMVTLLNRWEARTPVLVAAWLLLIVRSDLVPEYELLNRFGGRSLAIAKTACKLIFVDTTADNSRHTLSKTAHIEFVRRLFVFAYTDHEAVLITVADQLATAYQYEQMAKSEVQDWAQRNQLVYIPLLEMLGLWKHRTELGNISLYLLNPGLYEELTQRIAQYSGHHQLLLNTIAPKLQEMLKAHQIDNANVDMHITSPASVYKRIEKAKRRGETPKNEEISHLVIDVLVEHETDCYVALGLIHNTWKPALRPTNLLPGEIGGENRFADHIASPRFNGYRCLITSVLCETAGLPGLSLGLGDDERRSVIRLVEFRIRTYQMETVNNYGIAVDYLEQAHIKNVWWRNQAVRDIIKSGTTETLKNMTDIAVFSPIGEVIYPLRAGSTMIDLAFKIHSTLGGYARAFWVNGKPVSIEHEPRHRDLVEIEYDMHYPTVKPEWEDTAKYHSTKQNIRRLLRLRDRSPNKGRQRINEVLQREASIYRMRFPEEKIESTLTKIAKDFNCASVEALYLKIIEGIHSPDEIVAAMIEKELVEHIVVIGDEGFSAQRIRIAQTWMQEKEPRRSDPSSRVHPGVPIVGRYIGRDKHRILNVYRADSRFAPPPDQSVELRWRSAVEMREIVELLVTAPPRTHVIGMVFNAIHNIGKDNEQQRIIVHRFNAEIREQQLAISVLINAPTQISFQHLQEELKTIQRSGYITDFNVWQLFPGHKMLIAGRSDKRQHIPYTLSHVGSGGGMFYGREIEIQQIMQSIQHSKLVVLYGQKRIGKTSLLNQTADILRRQEYEVIPVIFDVLSLSPFDTVSFLHGLAEAALEKITARLTHPEDRKGLVLRKIELQTNPFINFANWVKNVQQRLKGIRLLFLVDEFTRAEEECRNGNIQPQFFDGLQWLVENQKVGFVLCVHDHILREKNFSWGLLQRGEPIRLDTLDRTSATRLIQQPLEEHYRIEPEVINRILSLSNCHPYFLQAICRQLMMHMAQVEHNYISQNDVDITVKAILPDCRSFFSHYQSSTGESEWEVLKFIAQRTDHDGQWISSDEIRQSVERYDRNIDRKLISKSLGGLKTAGLIEAQTMQGQAVYRIPVGLFHQWLRDVVTSAAVLRDLKGEE